MSVNTVHMTGLRFIQTAKGYLPAQPSPWKREPSTWLLSQTPWKCRTTTPLCWTSIYNESGNHLSTWMGPQHSYGRDLPHCRIRRGTGLSPSTHSKNPLDLEAREMSGAPWSMADQQVDVKPPRCSVAAVACWLWRTAWTVLKLLFYTVANHLSGLGSAIFL